MNAPGMLSDAEHEAILRYVAKLREMAEDDERAAYATPFHGKRMGHLREAMRRRTEADRWERDAERFSKRTIMGELLAAQLAESVKMEAAE